VGLLFLDHRFTIPNFPSRMLSYMEYSMPILACPAPTPAVGRVIVEGGFGWWCESGDVEGFNRLVCKVCSDELHIKGGRGGSFLTNNYTAARAYDIITNKVIEK